MVSLQEPGRDGSDTHKCQCHIGRKPDDDLGSTRIKSRIKEMGVTGPKETGLTDAFTSCAVLRVKGGCHLVPSTHLVSDSFFFSCAYGASPLP